MKGQLLMTLKVLGDVDPINDKTATVNRPNRPIEKRKRCLPLAE